ncbi:ankyrin [Piromyces finnis]|uniref:Ankyrin n=1 Tax=Piromyces finnis TaxID=1754191 RepID=A0A1Y1VKW5_9FUNG|nr:ankyrin [Piromyces finnis]|eukprot:ORX59107.1 ankyrin [Piromyces finnis]
MDKYFIENGFDINKKKYGGLNGLHNFHVKPAGLIDIVKYLIYKGIFIVEENINDIEYDIIMKSKIGYLRYNINGKDKNGNNLLIIAGILNHFELIKFFIENKINIFEKNIYGFKALMVATITRNLEIMKYLKDQGLDINIENKINIHRNDINNFNSLFLSCNNGYSEIVNYLINQGININENCLNWDIRLIYAAKKGYLVYFCEYDHFDVCKHLMNSGCDIKLKDNNNNCLFYSGINFSVQIEQYFIINKHITFY